MIAVFTVRGLVSGTIMMSKLHGMDSEMIIRTLENVSAPTTAKEIKVNEEQLIDALRIAQSLRPD